MLISKHERTWPWTVLAGTHCHIDQVVATYALSYACSADMHL